MICDQLRDINHISQNVGDMIYVPPVWIHAVFMTQENPKPSQAP